MNLSNWFWNVFPKKSAECICCEKTFPKEVMKEIVYQYTEEDGSTGVASMFACEPCLNEVADNLDEIAEELDRIGNE